MSRILENHSLHSRWWRSYTKQMLHHNWPTQRITHNETTWCPTPSRPLQKPPTFDCKQNTHRTPKRSKLWACVCRNCIRNANKLNSTVPFVVGFASEQRKWENTRPWHESWLRQDIKSGTQITNKSNMRKRIAHTIISQILCNRSRPNRRWAQGATVLNHTSPLQNFQSCDSCVPQMVFLSLSDNFTCVLPLLDTVAIETTPNNWNRNNQLTLDKQRIVKLSEPVRMRKSQDFSPTTKMLRMICVSLSTNHTRIRMYSKYRQLKLHLTIAWNIWTLLCSQKRTKNWHALLLNLSRTVIETPSFATRGQQRREPNQTKRVTNNVATLNVWNARTQPGRTKFLSLSTAHKLYRNTKTCFALRLNKKHHDQKNVQLRLNYRTVIGCSSSSSAWTARHLILRCESASLAKWYNLQRMLNHKRRILWANNRPESTHPTNRNFRVWNIKRPQKQQRPYADFISWTCMYLANNIPSLSELSYWRHSRKR